MSATDQLIIALATFVITLSGLLGPSFTILSHWVQSRQLKDNGGKLDRIDANTNGALAAVTAELAAVTSELAAVKLKLADLEVATAPGKPAGSP